MPDVLSKNLGQELACIVAEIIEVEPSEITLTAKFVEDLGMDSMMALEILAAVEKKYKLRIPEDYLGKISSLEELIEVTRKISEAKK